MAIDTETMQLIERIVARSVANATSLKGAADEIAKGVTQYVGARYVPLFAEPLEWDGTRAYEPLTIVLHQGNSYTSRQYVPVGVEIGDDSFWALTGNYNAQVEQYRREVKSLDGRVTANADAIARETEDRTAAVTAEKTRAEGAERTLTAKLGTETVRATEAERTLQANIDAEKTRADGAEKTLTAKLNTEMARAAKAERTLQANIDAEKTRAEDSEAEIERDLAAETNRASAAEKNNADGIAGINTRISELSTTTPTFVNSASEMTDTSKQYVLVSSGTVHAYIGGAWTDTGIKYVGSGNTVLATGINIYDGDSLNQHPECRDLNTIPPNTIYLFSYYKGISNLPFDESSGLLLTYSHNTAKAPGLATTQIFTVVTGQRQGAVAIRSKLLDGWGRWDVINDTPKSIMATGINIYDEDSLNQHPECRDLNTIPPNTIYLFSYYKGISNLPFDESSGLLLTYSQNSTKAPGLATTQIFTVVTGERKGAVAIRSKLLDGWGRWGVINDAPQSGDASVCSIGMFRKVGVIGDSYASGQIFNAQGSSLGTFYNLSWLQCMARRNGFEGINFSEGGLSTKTWLTSSKGLNLLESSEAQQLYILCLGINDRYQSTLGLSYLGSESDVHVGNPELNADSFYGNYARIIEKVKSKAPDAIVLIANIAGDSDKDPENKFNSAIDYLSKLYKLDLLDIHDDNYFKSAYYTLNMRGGHPTAPSYSAMSVAYQRLIENDMYDNPVYYSNYHE